ncbi:hypothetical protein UFOVP862_23 [uncultured Caudovirales phage]|uniref:Uncharacterized protein n=1 Tax=uncultured Caudovirales phage TaxID=2100421 RepID=A0A6J5PE62_9CAUD|nr:hypothetical protein UFOVP862_23 [uncultured Caudovirales phage]
MVTRRPAATQTLRRLHQAMAERELLLRLLHTPAAVAVVVPLKLATLALLEPDQAAAVMAAQEWREPMQVPKDRAAVVADVTLVPLVKREEMERMDLL